jgi:hypothetical protein
VPLGIPRIFSSALIAKGQLDGGGHDLALSEWKTRSGVKDPKKMSMTWAIARQEQALNAAKAPRMS